MAIPTCPHCSSTQFSLHMDQPGSAAFTLAYVVCAGCGAPIGVLQDENPNATIRSEVQQLSAGVAALAGMVTELRGLMPPPKAAAKPKATRAKAKAG